METPAGGTTIKVVADTPHIVIRTAEERLADERSGRYLLTEVPNYYHDQRDMPEDHGTRLIVDQAERNNATNIWRFPDFEAAVSWAALRLRELVDEGVDVGISPYIEIYFEIERKFPDSRILAPLTDYHERALKQKLQW